MKSGSARLALMWMVSAVLSLPCLAAEKSMLIKNLEAGKKQVVVAYGTSLTQGGAWVAQVGQALNTKFPDQVTMVNSGGSGMYSKWGVDNLEEKVLKNAPDAVFIEFGINDAVARFSCSVDQAKANVLDMIQRIRKARPQCEIILMTMTPGNKYPKGHTSHRQDIEAYYEMYRSVAKDEKLMLIDHYPQWRALQQKDEKLFLKYVPDTIHPTDEGCAQITTPAILGALGLPPEGAPSK